VLSIASLSRRLASLSSEQGQDQVRSQSQSEVNSFSNPKLNRPGPHTVESDSSSNTNPEAESIEVRRKEEVYVRHSQNRRNDDTNRCHGRTFSDSERFTTVESSTVTSSGSSEQSHLEWSLLCNDILDTEFRTDTSNMFHNSKLRAKVYSSFSSTHMRV